MSFESSAAAISAAVLLALAMAGPAAAGDATPPITTVQPTKPAKAAKPPPPLVITAKQRAEADRLDPLARAAFWDRVTQSKPDDVVAQVKLAAALRDLGRYQEASEDASRALVVAPDDLDALLEEGRDHIAAGEGFFAIAPLTKAVALAPKDWRCRSLLAIALDQDQRPTEALANHEKAVSLAPNNPSALSNLAMFEATHGEAAKAEALLRKALAEPGAGSKERENLALILGLEGRLREAEALERQDLPPSAVANNLAYFRAAAAPPLDRTWSSVEKAQ
ncbi:MAG: tetratricopeptide repeat protein [Caulobacteraceae bacterium]